jgi:hypothetical protein
LLANKAKEIPSTPADVKVTLPRTNGSIASVDNSWGNERRKTHAPLGNVTDEGCEPKGVTQVRRS